MPVHSTPTTGATTDESQNFQPQNLLGDMQNAVINVYNMISYHIPYMGGNKPKPLSCGDISQCGLLVMAVLTFILAINSTVLGLNTATKVGNIGYTCEDGNHHMDVEKNMLELTL